MSHRIEKIVSQLSPSVQQPSTNAVSSRPTAAGPPTKKPDDVVIVSALRTPIGRARRGVFKDTFIEDLLAPVLKATIERTKIDPKKIDDIIVGCVLGPGSQRANEFRIASFLAGIPAEVPIHVVNRQCSSGLQAVAHVAANIKAGNYEIGIAAGAESMTLADPFWKGDMNPKVFLNQQAKDTLLPMGITSENVASRYGITRKEQDELAVRSHQRAAEAIRTGRFKDEIVAVKTKIKDDKTGALKDIIVDTDDGVRADTTFAGLSKLAPAFTKNGTTTAGNSSQVSDGAAAVLLTSRANAQKLGLPIIGSFRSFAVTGVDPAVMGIGPATAIPVAVKKAGLELSDIDIFEINEAFASQATYCVKHLGLDWNKVNVNGGAIALGHPLGCTGARMTASVLSELKKRNARFGIVSMCIGSGMGAAAVYERE